MKARRLRFESERQYRALRSALVLKGYAHGREHGAFLFASQAGNGELDVVDVAVLKPDDFASQTAYYLELHDDALQEMIVRAHRTNTALIEAHSHPFTRGPRVRFSNFDCDKLSQNLEEQRRADLPAAVNRNGHGATVTVKPALVTASRASACESQASRDTLKLSRRRARHSRFRWYQWEARVPDHGTPSQSGRTRGIAR